MSNRPQNHIKRGAFHMKQLFKNIIGLQRSYLSSLATTVTAQTLEEVVVTAQKREQAITDVSIAMNAFTAEDMRSLPGRGRDRYCAAAIQCGYQRHAGRRKPRHHRPRCRPERL